MPSGGGDPVKSASQYEQVINGMQSSVVGRCAETGLASLDLVLLGSGADGHTASLYPGSKQVISETINPQPSRISNQHSTLNTQHSTINHQSSINFQSSSINNQPYMQVLISPSKRLVAEAAGKGGVTLTLDAMNSARNVILSAGKVIFTLDPSSTTPSALKPQPRMNIRTCVL